MEIALRNLDWKKGVKVDGEYLTLIRFADDIVLLGEDTAVVQQMLRELEKEGKKAGLKINRSKTKFMKSAALKKAPVTLCGRAMEVDSCVCLGQEGNMLNDLAGEISRRQRADWIKCSSVSNWEEKQKTSTLQSYP